MDSHQILEEKPINQDKENNELNKVAKHAVKQQSGENCEPDPTPR